MMLSMMVNIGFSDGSRSEIDGQRTASQVEGGARVSFEACSPRGRAVAPASAHIGAYERACRQRSAREAEGATRLHVGRRSHGTEHW